MKNKKLHKILFIEGTTDEASGSLSQGFVRLFSKVLEGTMPRIVMGDGKSTTINKFKKNKRSEYAFLLIDLDSPENKIDDKVNEYDLDSQKNYVFFMIQEVEAWFISQPQIIDHFFGSGISKKLPNMSPRAIVKPSLALQNCTKNSAKGKYHKVKHCVELLERLDGVQLMNDFPQFKQLVATIKST